MPKQEVEIEQNDLTEEGTIEISMNLPDEEEKVPTEKIPSEQDQTIDLEAQAETNADTLPENRLPSILESLFFVSDRVLSLHDLCSVLTEFSKEQIKQALPKLMDEKNEPDSGLVLVEVSGGYQMRTKKDNRDWIIRFQKAKPARLSRAALEALSIIAYRQPITRPEVDEIRGVDSSGTIRMLIERGLVRILGKRDEAGHPLLYGTTKEFLSFFQLTNLSDLPPLKEYTELGEDSLKKLEQLFPQGDDDIQANLDSEAILPIEEDAQNAIDSQQPVLEDASSANTSPQE
jgi:segregation and condensation protein B